MGTTLARCKRVLTAGLMAAAALLLTVPASAQTTFWELEPVREAGMAVGTFTTVGGRTTPAGVNFVLKNNKATQPQVLTLVSTGGGPLRLLAFKDAAPFLDRATGADGKLTVRFRTGEDIKFRVTGAAGAAYQLAVWRGPEIVPPPPSPVVAMDAALQGAAAARTTPAAAGASPESAKTGGGPGVLMYVLLGGILVALVVIAVLIFLGQRRKAGA